MYKKIWISLHVVLISVSFHFGVWEYIVFHFCRPYVRYADQLPTFTLLVSPIGVGTFSKLGGPGPRCSKPHLPLKSIFSSDFGHFIFASLLKSVKKKRDKKKIGQKALRQICTYKCKYWYSSDLRCIPWHKPFNNSNSASWNVPHIYFQNVSQLASVVPPL